MKQKIIELYPTHSVKQIAEILGISVSAAANRIWRLGLNTKKSANWTAEEIAELEAAYRNAKFSIDLDLNGLAKKFGRLKTNVSRKARELGLTDIGRKNLPLEVRKIRKPRFSSAEERSVYTSERVKKCWAENGHPRGSLGMKHSDETKKLISEKMKIWNDSLTSKQKAQNLKKAMMTKHQNGTYAMPRHKTTWKAGWREIGGIRKYYRSKWEANYAYYLEWLKGLGEIKEWKHEPKIFWFDGIKRGCVSYLPDFWVKNNDDSEGYHEVKGWMDSASKTKIKRMAKYHPEISLIVVDSAAYAKLKKQVSHIIPNWEE